jgi:dolichol kinase
MQELIHGLGVFALYLIPAAVIMLTARYFLRIPDELFRKILHFILLGAYIPFLFAFHTWWISAGFAGSLIVIIYPILALAGRIPAFSAFVNERKTGEFKSSMVLALLTVVFSISICWGLFGDKLLTLACVYAWGVGDAFAALVGQRFGKHKITLPFADSRKSWEGSGAMFVCSLLSVLTVLLIRGGMGFGRCLLISLAGATATTFVELCTKGGLDTITCPAAAMAVILPLIRLLGGVS